HDALQRVGRQGARAGYRLAVVRLVREAEASADRRLAVAERVVSEADAWGEIRFFGRVEPVDSRQTGVGQPFAEVSAGPRDHGSKLPLGLVDAPELSLAKAQFQIDF